MMLLYNIVLVNMESIPLVSIVIPVFDIISLLLVKKEKFRGKNWRRRSSENKRG